MSLARRKPPAGPEALREYERINSLQIKHPATILLALAIWNYSSPTFSKTTRKIFNLSYCAGPRWYQNLTLNPTTGLCEKGSNDIYFVVFGVLLLTLIRAAAMTYVYMPLGRLQGITKPKPLMRFSEQAWGFTWALTSWSVGTYLYYYSPYWNNNDELFSDHPNSRIAPSFKLYYLLQIAFWLQCMIAINVEAKRKDYHQMFGHHIITSALLIGSYQYGALRVGHVILALMDFADIFLPLAKMLKYTGHQTLCDGTFVVFLTSWFTTRHYLLCKIIYKCYVSQPLYISPDRNDTWIFVALLAGLELLICMWSFAIARVLWSIMNGAPLDDSRSDTEVSETSSSGKGSPALQDEPDFPPTLAADEGFEGQDSPDAKRKRQ